MKIITNKQIKEIKDLIYSEQNFDKFLNPLNPLYEDYKDREFEMGHDKGNNNAIENVLIILKLNKWKTN